MLTLEEISNRFEIQELAIQYCHFIDQREFYKLSNIFTEDAVIDYTAMGGIKGCVKEIIAFLEDAMANFSNFQHMISNHQINFSSDNNNEQIATGRILCLNPMAPSKDTSRLLFMGFWYIDEYVKTNQGWRIHHRIEEKSFSNQLQGKVL